MRSAAIEKMSHHDVPQATFEMPGLAWSEHCYLVAVALAALVAVDPLGWKLNGDPLFKHLPIMLTLPALVLTVIGRRLSMPPGHKSGVGRILAVAWPFALLTMLIVGGSLYARLFNGVQTTFLSVGLYMSLVFVSATMLIFSEAPLQLIRAHCRILLVGAFVMSCLLMINLGVREVYHEQIFLLIPMGVFCVLAWRRQSAAWGGLVFFLAMALPSAKNTSYLVDLLVVVYLALLLWFPKFKAAPPITRMWGYYLAFVAMLIMAAGVLFLLYYREHYLPSGNVEYRSHTYGLAWGQFLESPLWGTLFAAESVKKFTLYSIGIAGGRLPTHSDVMDLLAHGGSLGTGLWLLGLGMIGLFAYKNLLSPKFIAHPLAPYAHTMAALSLAGVLTYAFNPIMLQPGMAYLLWTNLGMLLGLALCKEKLKTGHLFITDSASNQTTKGQGKTQT